MCLFNLYGAHNDVVAVGTQDMCLYNSRVGYAHPSGTPVLDPGFWLEFVFPCFSFIFVLALLLVGHVLHLWFSVFVFGNYKISVTICLSFRPFGFIAPKTLNYLAFQSFDFERTWWRLFQKRVVRTKFDIYLFYYYRCHVKSNECGHVALFLFLSIDQIFSSRGNTSLFD